MKATHASNDSIADVAGERAKQYVDSGVDVYNNLAEKTQAVGKRVDGYVRTNPWMMIGAAAGVGLLLGLMIRRR
jgi:ElaB/YqjD/DUF883 family membrane-anchored ribosome-binding protein